MHSRFVCKWHIKYDGGIRAAATTTAQQHTSNHWQLQYPKLHPGTMRAMFAYILCKQECANNMVIFIRIYYIKMHRMMMTTRMVHVWCMHACVVISWFFDSSSRRRQRKAKKKTKLTKKSLSNWHAYIWARVYESVHVLPFRQTFTIYTDDWKLCIEALNYFINTWIFTQTYIWT